MGYYVHSSFTVKIICGEVDQFGQIVVKRLLFGILVNPLVGSLPAVLFSAEEADRSRISVRD